MLRAVPGGRVPSARENSEFVDVVIDYSRTCAGSSADQRMGLRMRSIERDALTTGYPPVPEIDGSSCVDGSARIQFARFTRGAA